MTGEPEDKVALYQEAYETWQKHLAALHEVLIEQKRVPPVQIKGILNREARAKRRYDVARLRLLGVEEEGPFDDTDEDDDE
jgi:hypothetical protein